MKAAKILKDLSNLMSVKNYASRENVSPSYIYKLIRENKMDSFSIDGIQFIEVDRFPTIPIVNRRK